MIKINLYGAPSSGKTTLAGQIFASLKSKRYNIAYVQEYSKDLVYQGIDMRTLGEIDRINILAEQLRREKILKNKVDYLVTDSPLCLTAYYHKDPLKKEDWSYAKDIALRHLNDDEFHFWLGSVDEYEFEGRSHTPEESDAIQKEMKNYLRKECGINLIEIKGSPEERLKKVLNHLKII